jgi:hypothetical protein
MSYNKFLNKILNNQNNGNVLTFNTQNQSLSFKNNIQISQFQNENIKIENDDLSTLVFSKAQGLTSSLSFQENLNFTKLKVSDLSYENSGDDTIFLLKNDNSKTQINNADLEISSSDFKAKKLYGNLTYVDQAGTIPWLSGSSSETVKVSFFNAGGYSIGRQNINLNNTTYVTCDPTDEFSNYPVSDIVSSSNTTYNFVNDAGVYTNILYLRPGRNPNNKDRYLSSNEHTFIIDVQKSPLPDWGFEENHPVLQIPNYSQLKNEILSNNTIKKNSQSIALDMSALVNTNSISPGYRVNIFFANAFSPESLPCIFHSSNESINTQNSLWENFTFDSRYCYIEKNDFDLMSQTQKDYFKISSNSLSNNQITSNIYTVPYYNTLSTPTFLDKETQTINTNGNSTPTTSSWYRQTGSYSENRIILNYFKPVFFINLGENNQILNETSSKSLKKNISNKINTNPFIINAGNVSTFNNVFNKSNNNMKYFISYYNSLKQNDIDVQTSGHASLNNQNFANTQSSFHYSHISNAFNSGNNLTLKIKSQYIDVINQFKYLSFFQSKKTKEGIMVTTYKYSLSGTPKIKYQTNTRQAYILRTRTFINLPFNNLINPDTLTNISDWYYLNQWKINRNSYNISNTIDLSLNDTTIENSFSAEAINIINDDFSMKTFLNNYSVDFSTPTFNQFSLMYLGLNSSTNKHEWVYV